MGDSLWGEGASKQAGALGLLSVVANRHRERLGFTPFDPEKPPRG